MIFGYYHIMRNQPHVHVVTLSITTAASLLTRKAAGWLTRVVNRRRQEYWVANINRSISRILKNTTKILQNCRNARPGVERHQGRPASREFPWAIDLTLAPVLSRVPPPTLLLDPCEQRLFSALDKSDFTRTTLPGKVFAETYLCGTSK